MVHISNSQFIILNILLNQVNKHNTLGGKTITFFLDDKSPP